MDIIRVWSIHFHYPEFPPESMFHCPVFSPDFKVDYVETVT